MQINFEKMGRKIALLLILLLAVDSISRFAGTGKVYAETESRITVRAELSSGESIAGSGDTLLEAVGGFETARKITVLEICSGTMLAEDWQKLANFSILTEFLVGEAVRADSLIPGVEDWDSSYIPKTVTKVQIPEGVAQIGTGTFSRCSELREVTMPESMKQIGAGAFYACKNLTAFHMNENLETIDARAFDRCGRLSELTLPAGLKTIGNNAFISCSSLKTMTIPDSVTTLGSGVFDCCSSLKEVTLSDRLGTIPEYTFRSCSRFERLNIKISDTENVTPLSASEFSFQLCSESRVAAFYTVAGELLSGAALQRAAEAYLAVEDGDTGDSRWYGCEIEKTGAVETPTPTPTLTPTPTPTPTSEPTPTPPPAAPTEEPVPTVMPTITPTPVPSPETTPTLAPDPAPTAAATGGSDKDVSDIAEGLGVSGETAEKIQGVAKELEVSKDTILVTDKTITTKKNDKDIKGAYFARIQARVSQVTENNIKLTWNSIKGADGYRIYSNRCNTRKYIYEYKLSKTIKNKNTRSYIKRKCKKGTYYKFVVRAYKVIDGRKVTIAVSKTIHVVTNGGANGNPGSVRLNKTKKTLKTGKTFRLKAKEIRKDKKLRHHREIAFESSNPKVAAVSQKGSIRAKKKGKCTIYIYAQNGIYKKVKVKVT